MAIALAAASIIAVIGIITSLNYRTQFKKLCVQLRYINKHDTNMIVSATYGDSADAELANEMNELIFRFRELQKEYSSKEANLKGAITGLSHDIRTPLTSLDGYFQLLNESESKNEREKYTAVIRERISSLTMILDELFTYAKLQDDSYELEIKSIELNKLLHETAFSFYDDFKRSGIEPIIEITDLRIFVDGNYIALKRAIQNIIKNCLVHGKSFFQIVLAEDNGEAIITIKNNRSDSEDIEIEQVFDKFYKADLSRNNTSTGLGLPIAKEIIEKINGKIEAFLEDEMFVVRIKLKAVTK